MPHKVVDFIQIKQFWKRCVNGYKTGQKLFSQIEFTSLWNTGTNVSKGRGQSRKITYFLYSCACANNQKNKNSDNF